MAGVEVVVHCASSPRGGDDVAAGHLIEAARRAGTVTNIVYISIVGVDVVPYGYYVTKLKVERMLEESGLGLTILRTTQFHDLVARVVDVMGKLPVVPVPKGVRMQPISVGEVADRLAELAVPVPAGRVPDMGGPEIHSLSDLARSRRPRGDGPPPPRTGRPAGGQGLRGLPPRRPPDPDPRGGPPELR